MKRTAYASLAAAAIAAGLFAAPAARAGPPYVTDDPQPTDRGHWEIYNYASGTHTPGDTAGEGGLDLNYGAARDLQLTAVLPLGYDVADRTRVGVGRVELAAKYKLLHQDGFGLDVAVFPRVFLPSPEPRFGPRRVNLLLPVWAGKDFGPWSVFGGGGYTVNTGPEERSFWTSGLAVTRQFGERLQLGGEIYHAGPDAKDGRASTGLNLGVTWKVARQWSLLASGGPGVQNAREAGLYDFYVALEATY